jgi:hypothetical protein
MSARMVSPIFTSRVVVAKTMPEAGVGRSATLTTGFARDAEDRESSRTPRKLNVAAATTPIAIVSFAFEPKRM